MNPISVAIRGKGYRDSLSRAVSVARHYGLTPDKLERALAQLVTILRRFGCSATLPITSVVLGRNPRIIKEYQEHGIEFAIHGYRHIDHCQLSQTEQLAQLALARQLFAKVGIQVQGFRGPYLHANRDTLAALEQQCLIYDNSQSLSWDVLDGLETQAYRFGLGFYGTLSASDYPSLPSLEGNLVRIPYSLPDDESLVDRLSLERAEQMNTLWLAILRRSYELGELFVLGLHPERTFTCQEPLAAVLSQAHQLGPPVWIARLDEIAAWWRARSEAEVRVADIPDGKLRVDVAGPEGVTVLARGVELDTPSLPWSGGYQQILASTFVIHASLRPFIGLSPNAAPELSSFLRQQGYVVEVSEHEHRYALYLEQTDLPNEDQRALVARIEEKDYPLVRLGRWPDGARSALAITGDIDALTVWDYGLRFLGR